MIVVSFKKRKDIHSFPLLLSRQAFHGLRQGRPRNFSHASSIARFILVRIFGTQPSIAERQSYYTVHLRYRYVRQSAIRCNITKCYDNRLAWRNLPSRYGKNKPSKLSQLWDYRSYPSALLVRIAERRSGSPT